ncbi:hypothetical protein EVAR_95994_1 [Eumeta japonica]|uniref:Uncharacterized protein n=1 Tax=Eumeta variegata TaxID=151549 RepID=A0A4C2A1S7_EUMVA|nr:hypothetical protein EVAR_95994_1 [Eumeta japonica]
MDQICPVQIANGKRSENRESTWGEIEIETGPMVEFSIQPLRQYIARYTAAVKLVTKASLWRHIEDETAGGVEAAPRPSRTRLAGHNLDAARPPVVTSTSTPPTSPTNTLKPYFQNTTVPAQEHANEIFTITVVLQRGRASTATVTANGMTLSYVVMLSLPPLSTPGWDLSDVGFWSKDESHQPSDETKYVAMLRINRQTSCPWAVPWPSTHHQGLEPRAAAGRPARQAAFTLERPRACYIQPSVRAERATTSSPTPAQVSYQATLAVAGASAGDVT